jgi:hypothetical protein
MLIVDDPFDASHPPPDPAAVERWYKDTILVISPPHRPNAAAWHEADLLKPRLARGSYDEDVASKLAKLANPDDVDDVEVSAKDLTPPAGYELDDPTGEHDTGDDEVTWPAPGPAALCQQCAMTFIQHRNRRPVACRSFKRMTEPQIRLLKAPLLPPPYALDEALCPVCANAFPWSGDALPAAGDWCNDCRDRASDLISLDFRTGDANAVSEVERGRFFRKSLMANPDIVVMIKGSR